MIGVLTLFGKIDLQPVLKKSLAQKQIYFISENCNTSVQLMAQVEEHQKEIDAVIINADSINMDSFDELVNTIREKEKMLRIILILNGSQGKYLRETINEYKSMRIDLIFDDDGFEVELLTNFLEKGKLSHRDFKEKRISSGFDEEIRENEEPKKAVKKFTQVKKTSFSNIRGRYVISVINTTRGAGTTKTVFDLARYFVLHNFKTCVLDYSVTKAISTIKIKDVPIYDGNDLDFNSDKYRNYNILILDMGTPFNISSDGEKFSINESVYNSFSDILSESQIKIFMGLTDSWNIGRLKYILDNEEFKKKIDNSYLFLVPKGALDLKKEYPQYNIVNRDEDFKEPIMEQIREEESANEDISE